MLCLKCYGFVLWGVEYLAYAVRDADEGYVQNFSFGFSYILSLLQQNSLSCFLKVVGVFYSISVES